MTSDHALALLFAIGHALLILFVLNTSHGLGVNAPWIDHAVLLLLGLAGLAGLGLVWSIWGMAWTAWPILIRAYSVACFGIALVGFPAATVARLVRKPPVGTRLVASTDRDFRTEEPELSRGGEGWKSRWFHLPMNDSLRLSVADWEVTLPEWPTALDGFSILHLTDIHFARTYPRAYFEWALKQATDGPEPDLIAITGDFLDDDHCASWIEPILGPLPARVGRYAILGNHDYRKDFRSVRRALKAADYRVLEGRWETIDVQGCSLAIGGTSEPWGKSLSGRKIPQADARLLLSHSPDRLYSAARQGVNLMLAGHVHGGQVRLPVIGPILMPSIYCRRFDRGFFRSGGTTLFVGQGLGSKDPIRLNCPPEIVRLTIRSVKNGLDARPLGETRSKLARV